MDAASIADNKLIDAQAARIAKLERALKPFADRVYNDNGDVTFSTQALDTDDLFRAWCALHRS